ncbi:MAG: hypothetical protein DRR19_05570 [Candidatus Parabeggiatoa sp. nov. 1]|nr:MAG: hypothetical protein DRR19_05570 [Gammaproteobacteria bacterium]
MRLCIAFEFLPDYVLRCAMNLLVFQHFNGLAGCNNINKKGLTTITTWIGYKKGLTTITTWIGYKKGLTNFRGQSGFSFYPQHKTSR